MPNFKYNEQKITKNIYLQPQHHKTKPQENSAFALQNTTMTHRSHYYRQLIVLVQLKHPFKQSYFLLGTHLTDLSQYVQVSKLWELKFNYF